MAKKCAKCAREFDDSRGVCLFCGSPLERREECERTCAGEGNDRQEAVEEKKAIRGVGLVLIIVILVAVILVFSFTGGMHFWSTLVERMVMELVG
ncbi:MAG: hypothetical protein GF408_02575 [Candidatus Omnitrophica bacterium]|nr:hypothetical protein [Candidatus Omnitrophota bacterium]